MGNVFCNPTEYKTMVPRSSDSQKTTTSTKTMDSFTDEKSNESLSHKPLPTTGRPGLVWVGKIKGALAEESLNQSVSPIYPIEQSVVDEPPFRTLAQRQNPNFSVDINSNDTHDKRLHENEEIPASSPNSLPGRHSKSGPCIFEQIATCTFDKILAEIADGEQRYQEDQSILSATSDGALGNPFDEACNVPMTAEHGISDTFGRAARCDESRLDMEKQDLQRITTEGIPCSVVMFLSMNSPVSVQDSDDFVDPAEHRQTKAPDHFFCHIETYPAEDWDDDDNDAYSIFRANCSVFGMQSKQSIELPVQELCLPILTQIGHVECSNQRQSFRFRRIFFSSKVETNIDVASCYLVGVSDQRWMKLGMLDRLFCRKKKNFDDDISAVTFRIYSRAQL
ncbi:hypothetical protein IV203_023661 [Nitzschia inconspicua]|uniref:Uncharacterized protein n=1 Tax=Nitzschia inconspicua TaxID=303405 RepID=A0A9K3KDN6_9STRA|nr:hypothetical protein IV203_023661 [Nitzschia inconspicua]